MTPQTKLLDLTATLDSEFFKDAWYAFDSAMILSSADGVVLDVNEAFCALYTCDRAQHVGKTLLSVFPETVRQTQRDAYAALCHPSAEQDVVVSVFNYRQVILEANSRLIPRSLGRHSSVIVTVLRDLTEQISRIRYLERQNEFAGALSELSQVLLSNPTSPQEQHSLLEQALEVVRTTLSASRAYYWQCFEGPGKALHVRALAMTCTCGIPCEILERSRIGVPLTMFPGPMQRAFESRQPFGGLIEEEYAEMPDLRDFYLGQNPPLTSLQMVPLHIDDVNWGFVAVDQVIDKRRWTEQEVAFLKTASEIIGGTFQRWSIHDDLKRQAKYANAIARCSHILLDNPAGLDAKLLLVDQALDIVRRMLDASRAYYMRVYEDPERGPCLTTLVLNSDPSLNSEITERSRQGIPWSTLHASMRRALERQEPFGVIVEEDWQDRPDLVEYLLSLKGPMLSFQMAPLLIDGVQWGAIGIDDVHTRRRWNDEQVNFLRTVSEIVGSASQRWLVHEDLEAQVEKRTLALQQANTQLNEEIGQRRRTEQDLQRRLQVENALWDISQRLLQPETSADTWRAVLQRIGSLVGAQRMMLVPMLGDRIDPESQIIQWSERKPNPHADPPTSQWATDAPWLWQQVMHGEIVYLPNLGAFPAEAAADRRSVLLGDVVRSLALIPMSGDRKENTNVLVFLDFEEREDLYQDARAETLRIMRFGAGIIENKLRLDSIYNALEDRVAQRTRELITVLDFAMLTSSTESLSEILVPALELIADIGHCDAICIHLHAEDRQALVLSAQQGLREAQKQRLQSVPMETIRSERGGEPKVTLSALPSPTDLPSVLQLPGYRHYLGCELHLHGQFVGLLSVYRASADEFSVNAVSLITVLAEQLGLVIENHRMRIQIRDAAIEKERQRLRQELHDSITQSLYGLTLFARVGRYALEDEDESQLRDSLIRVENGANAIHKEMRLLLFQLQPFTLDNLSLAQAVENRFDALERKLGIKALVDMTDDADLPDDLKFELYRITMEALNNSLKHADASKVSAVFSESNTEYILTITDNGVSFDPNNAKAGMGLRHMRERALSIDAALSINATSGNGTTVRLQIPKGTFRSQRALGLS
ncbi:MAG: histidine kinase [Caldilineaceae bacterium]